MAWNTNGTCEIEIDPYNGNLQLTGYLMNPL